MRRDVGAPVPELFRADMQPVPPPEGDEPLGRTVADDLLQRVRRALEEPLRVYLHPRYAMEAEPE